MKNFFYISGETEYDPNTINPENLERNLKIIFNETELLFSDRFNKSEAYDELLKKANDNTSRIELPQNIKKLSLLVLGNIYLRKGQQLDEEFNKSKKCYRKAIRILLQGLEIPEDTSETNLLLKLLIGKYFRNMGRHGRRSNYRTAIDEFKSVANQLEMEPEKEEPWNQQETYLWLEASVNVGIAQKRFYLLNDAADSFWNIIRILACKMERESEIYTHIKKDTENILINAWENSDKIKKSKLHVIARLNQQQANYQSFLIQSVLQLGIVYRKKRDFQQAEILFHYVDTIDRSPDMNENTQNIDAANNLGVCLRKRGLYEDACKIFSPFSEKGNRFACINKMKCELKLKQLHVEDINRLLKKNPYDREVLLIKGAYFKKNKKWNKAMKTYKMAYELAPYIRPGTIGLKAYYNMAVCLLHQHKIYEARKMLEKILEECPDDIPAKIDLGRCLKEIGRYSEALEIYEHMFEAADTNSSININKLPKHSKIKIYNYCGECYLHLKNIYHAKQQFHNVLIADAENTRASYFLAQCAMHEGSRYEANNCRKAAADEYILAMDNYRKASERQPENTQFASAWLINRIELWNKNWWKEAGLTESIERSLKYFSGSYSLNACIALVSYIEHQEQNAEKAAKTKISELYKAFSRIRLDKDEEGYYAFSHFLKNHSFMHLEAETRGKILACLFRIYENTIGIKKLCRYSLEHATNSEIELVHYTKLNVLKKLLEQRQKTPPRMRLWNSVYMNDPYEGETFINLMQCVGNAKCGILESYFPYLKKESQKLTPINSNIYISSLSKQVDNIRMWVQYGDDASGCGIFFEDDFFDIRSNSATATDTSLYTDKDYPLYKVNYIETNTFLKKCEEKEENDYKKIRAHLEKVWTYMDKLEYIIKDKNLNPRTMKRPRNPPKYQTSSGSSLLTV